VSRAIPNASFVAVIIAAAVGLAACGSSSSDDTSTKTSTGSSAKKGGADEGAGKAKKGNKSKDQSAKTGTATVPKGKITPGKCHAAQVHIKLKPKRQVKQGANLTTNLGASKVQLQVKESSLRASIPGHFGVAKPFAPGKGNQFLTVTYVAKNEGKAAIVPRRTLNESAVVTSKPPGSTWASADLARCGPVSASMASVAGTTSPNTAIEAGKTGTTVAAFIVPSKGRHFVLNLPGQQVAFALRPKKV
jgi:hypothetical protein